MVRLRSVLLCLVLLGCAGAPLLFGVPVAAAHPRATDASARGVVVNGSRGDAPASGQAVVLTAIVGGQAQQVATAKTDAHGAFAFENLQPDTSASYVLTTDFAGGTFATGELTADALASQQQTLRVFDTTSSDANIAFALVTMVVSEPNQHTGRISIAENITVTNGDNKAYVATIAPANGQPMNLLRFALPTGATNLVLGAGFATGQTVQAPTGFGLATTIPPGKTDFAFAYDLPYDGTELVVPFKSVYATNQAVVLLPLDLHALPGDFTVRPSIQAAGTQYQVLERTDMASGTTATFQLRGLPVPGEAPYLSAGSLFGVGIGLALIMAVLLALYLRHGGLPMFSDTTGTPAIPGRRATSQDRQRNDLLREHLELDQLHSAGKLDDAEYRERREQLRLLLRSLVPTGALDVAPTEVEPAGPGGDVGPEQAKEPAQGVQNSHGQPRAETGRGGAK